VAQVKVPEACGVAQIVPRWAVRPKKVGFERMSDILTPLILDFLAWLEATPRSYAEVMDVWRTSCPRLTIWEDAVDADLVAHLRAPGEPATIGVTDKGRKMLEARSRVAG
jgi:hypothetical protein